MGWKIWGKGNAISKINNVTRDNTFNPTTPLSIRFFLVTNCWTGEYLSASSV